MKPTRPSRKKRMVLQQETMNDHLKVFTMLSVAKIETLIMMRTPATDRAQNIGFLVAGFQKRTKSATTSTTLVIAISNSYCTLLTCHETTS